MTKGAKQKTESSARDWLEVSARWRLLSLCFQLPTPVIRREIKRLSKTAAEPLAEIAAEWASAPLQEAAAEYHRVLGPGGVPAVESSYDPNALAGRGPLLADIAGFYEAFAYRPEEPPAAVPDHIAVQLDFLSYLAMKAAFALHDHRPNDARITVQAYQKFQREHLYTWLREFQDRLVQSGSTIFVHAAECIPQPRKSFNRQRTKNAGVVALLFLLFAIPAVGQAQAANPASETTAQANNSTPKAAVATSASPPIRIGDVTITGSLRARMENWSWFEAPAGEDTYTFGALNLRLALEQKKERFEWKIEGLFPWLIELPTRAVLPPPQGQLGLGASYFAANGGQDGSAVFRQGYVRFKKLFGDTASSVRLGRFEFGEGAETSPTDATLAILKRDRIAHRLIGNFGFSHVGRGFDGVEFVRNTKQDNLTLLAARPTEGVFQLRSLKQLDVDIYYGAFTRQFGGKQSQSDFRAFALHYHDGRGATKTDNRPAVVRVADQRNIRLTTIGAHWIGVFGSGDHKTDLLIWGAAQFGRWGALNHQAGAIAAEIGHQFPGRWKPWLRGGFFRSSGDGNPNDNEHSTFFQVLPTPRVYARFPFFNLMNNQDVFMEFRLKPTTRLAIRADIRHLRLSSGADLWYLGGGSFQEGTFGFVGRPSNQNKSLGTLFDLSFDYDLTKSTRLTFFAGGVRGGDVPSAIYPAGGSNPGARFLYLEFVTRF
jgi:TorA maturation chaperone TorD